MSRSSTLGLGANYTEGGTSLFTRSWNGQTGDTRYQTFGLMVIGKVYAFLKPDKKAPSGPYFRFDLSGLRMRDQFLVHGTSTVISDNRNLGMSIGVGFGYTLQIKQRLLLDGGARFAFTYFPSAVASDDFDHRNAGMMFGNDLARIWLGVGVLLSR